MTFFLSSDHFPLSEVEATGEYLTVESPLKNWAKADVASESLLFRFLGICDESSTEGSPPWPPRPPRLMPKKPDMMSAIPHNVIARSCMGKI